MGVEGTGDGMSWLSYGNGDGVSAKMDIGTFHADNDAGSAS